MVRVIEVFVFWESFNNGDCFILDLGNVSFVLFFFRDYCDVFGLVRFDFGEVDIFM